MVPRILRDPPVGDMMPAYSAPYVNGAERLIAKRNLIYQIYARQKGLLSAPAPLLKTVRQELERSTGIHSAQPFSFVHSHHLSPSEPGPSAPIPRVHILHLRLDIAAK